MLHSLWHTPSKWISDPFGYVFLPRAMLEIGGALFPNEWAGEEPVISLALEPGVIALLHSGVSLEWVEIKKAQQEAERIAEWQRQEAERKRQEAVAKAKRAAPVFPSRRRSLDDPVKAAARAYAKAASSPRVKVHRVWEDAQFNAAQRYASVCAEVARGCRNGKLISGCRPKEGGSVMTIPNVSWNTEGFALQKRFAGFSLDPSRPFLAGGTNNEAWICISRDSLDTFIARLGSTHASTVRDESEAIRYLTHKLKQEPDLKRIDAETECKQFGISQRGFRDRVWPKARERAGLSATAPPGRKKAKNRNAESKR